MMKSLKAGFASGLILHKDQVQKTNLYSKAVLAKAKPFLDLLNDPLIKTSSTLKFIVFIATLCKCLNNLNNSGQDQNNRGASIQNPFRYLRFSFLRK